MTEQFLPRDPLRALLDVKEELYDRLTTLRQCIKYNLNGDDSRCADGIDIQMLNEVSFLESLLDKIERS